MAGKQADKMAGDMEKRGVSDPAPAQAPGGSHDYANFPRKFFSLATPNMPTFSFYVRTNVLYPRFMRTFPAFSFRGEHNGAWFMRRFPEISFRLSTGCRERGEKFFYENVWGACTRKKQTSSCGILRVKIKKCE